MPAWDAAEAAHIAGCQLCAAAITARATFTGPGCHIHIGGDSGAQCPHPPIAAIDNQIIPEDKRVCERHLYMLVRPVIQQLQETTRIEARIQDHARNPGPTLDHTGEDLALDDNGQPVPNENIRREAQQLLAEIRRDRDKILGTGPN